VDWFTIGPLLVYPEQIHALQAERGQLPVTEGKFLRLNTYESFHDRTSPDPLSPTPLASYKEERKGKAIKQAMSERFHDESRIIEEQDERILEDLQRQSQEDLKDLDDPEYEGAWAEQSP